ncbi:ABC-2 type transporter [Nannochloropsis gaditana]|uniref:ABC-2 type transporter n=1 Tax=Nannochloropsis gaditana TaxID=72520 RepID=W7TBW5_9STRA|nr:ABC-2 type transporter [Nannochloropsis gaditana]
MPSLFDVRPLYYKEKGANVVRTLAFCLSLDTPYLLINACTSCLFTLVLHLLVPLRPGLGPFLYYAGALLLMSWTSLSLIVFLSSTLPSIRRLSSLWSFLGYVITVSAGFMARVPSMPAWANLATLFIPGAFM